MKNLLILVIMLSNLAAFSQKGKFVTADFDRAPLGEVITVLKAQTDLNFFFKSEWIDSAFVSAKFKEVPIDSVLKVVFTDNDFSFIRLEQDIILTNDVIVYQSPEISQYVNERQAAKPLKGLVFTKDYEEPSNQGDQLIEVGKRSTTNDSDEAVIAGFIKDTESGEPIVGALVYSKKLLRTATTDGNGFYSIKLPKGKNILSVQFLGMKSVDQSVVLFSDGKVDFSLENDIVSLNEVTVNADRDENIESVIMGVSKIGVEETKNVPIVLGERDIMKIATTTAGVQTVGEGASGFNVRGGKSDQNLILFNDATIYNANHFFGFFSVFNSDAIESMDVYKSSIPAQFGGRLSSVFDITSVPGEIEEFSAIGGISPITSRLTLKIPIIKEKAGLMVGGRATYSNWLLRAIDNGNFSENEVSFGDLILKYDHAIDEENDLSVSGYLSVDKFRLSSDTLFAFSDFSFQNRALSASWKRRFSDDFNGKLTTSYSAYDYLLSFEETAENAFEQDFKIADLTTSLDFKYFHSEKHELSFGAGTIKYMINPGTRVPLGSASIVQSRAVTEDQGLESFLYLSDDFSVNERIKLSAGLRYSLFLSLGPQSVAEYNPDLPRNNLAQTGSSTFDKGSIVETYQGPEVRVSARYAFDPLTSVKFSYNKTRQYLHSLTNSESLSPTDIWRLSNTHILPQIGDQVSVGFYRNLFNKSVEFSAESYYKWLQNLLDIKVGSQFLLNEQVETAVLQGPGKSYGVEFSLRKNTGKLNGWINYTYARTLIKIEGSSPAEAINNGQYYPTNYDKPHTINLVANYKLTKRFSLSYNFNYSTGRPVTLPVGVYDFNGNKVLHYSERNAFRIPNYMRMDIGISLEEGHMIKKLTHSYWSFSIYNLLGRDNPFSIFYDIRDNQVKAYKLVVFGNAIPTISFNFRI